MGIAIGGLCVEGYRAVQDGRARKAVESVGRSVHDGIESVARLFS